MSGLNGAAIFVIQTLGSLYLLIVLLRFILQLVRANFYNPICQFTVKATQPLLKPLRRVIPPVGRWDVSSLVAAVLLQLAQYFLLTLLLSAASAWAWLPWLALFGLARVAVSGLIGLLIVYAVMSWVQARSPLADVIARLCEPVLRPFRRIIPLVGGIDLSPLAVLVLLQVAMIVLGHLQTSVMR